MAVSFYIARRYLVSKKSNNAITIISWISICAIAVTTGALVVILSAMNGLTGTVAALYNTFEPDLKISLRKGKYFAADSVFLQRIVATPGVELISQSLNDKALLKNEARQTIVSVKGVDAVFSRVTGIDTSVVEGRYAPDAPGHPVLLGRGIANQLQLNISGYTDELSLFCPTRGKVASLNPSDNMTQLHCNPTGVFSLSDEFDYQYVFTNLSTARLLFDAPGQLSAIEVKVKAGQIATVQHELEVLCGDRFLVRNRYQLNDTLFKSLETEKLATFIILAFILVIATFNIIGALTMLIIEKKKDIRTLYSMGADRGLVRNVFMTEGLLITGVGSFIGLVLGLVVCWLQMQFHLVKFGNDFIVPYYPIELQAADLAGIVGLIMLIGFFAALYPVRVFTRVDLLH